MPFAAPFQPYETVQFMSSGNGAIGAPCDPETPEQMLDFIRWQSGLSETAGIGGDLIQVEVSERGVKFTSTEAFFELEVERTI